ncbi:MAG: DUF5808 domain-containing protein [Chloroflexota bacterium]
MKRLSDLVRFASMVLLGVAIYQEMQRPPEQRKWHGKIMDFFPYDLRVPTVERAKARMWNPEEPRLWSPTVFGVGWTLNFGRLYSLLSGQAGLQDTA